MMTLGFERCSYLRVGRDMTKKDIESIYGFPVNREVFQGAIIKVPPRPNASCSARPGDDYATIALRVGADASEIEALNGNSPIYPGKKVWLPPIVGP